QNPLVWVENGQIHEIKADKYAVGGWQPEESRTFTLHTLDAKNRHFYLFSDGFQDQFGGNKRRKYMVKQFRNFLQEISKYPSTQQAMLVHAELSNWKGDFEQNDDVLVIGFSV
ncbi:MAG: serine/threonine protein kinase, partial [Bacteroidia bacterium]|nr:serine/threonine protein kinase [Bacteroidia bacterium]